MSKHARLTAATFAVAALALAGCEDAVLDDDTLGDDGLETGVEGEELGG